jgi:hypothetical protein
MDLNRARFLVSPRGRVALASLREGLALLPLHAMASELRKAFPPEEASALAEQVDLRAGACEKLGDEAAAMLFSRHGLEMMTHSVVAERRAKRLARLGLPVVDLTCGLGGDLRAVVATGVKSVGLEMDKAAVLLAAANVPLASIVRGDATSPPLRIGESAVIIDPSRRGAAGRRFDPNAFVPDWNACLALLGEARAGVLKTAPGLDHAHIPVGAEAEFVQLGRGMRECAIWLGGDAEPGLKRAVLLPASAELTSADPAADAATAGPEAFLFDPESCVTRAGLVLQLGHLLGGRMMDGQVAYLTGPVPGLHPMAACFELLEIVPFSIARLRGALRAGRWKPSEIRRRAFPIEPDELRRLLGPLEGDGVTLLCTTIARQRTVFIARKVPMPPPTETDH